ncbi:MAG: DUF4112 domain-containing protein [Cyanosarcina radialis HA8281-LM2]|jgi:hypothetical protein|nr:DUF4112 domain-containing protein [Cyanosarcina radialis HA8281-LM2]
MSKSSLPTEIATARLNRLRMLTYLLDNSIPISGTSYRIGIDPLIGFIPGVGDFLGMSFSGYLVLEAALMGLPKVTLIRMAANILLETLVGTVPFVGDWFDFAWKANVKNMALLEAHLTSGRASKRADWWFITLLLGVLFLVAIAVAAISISIFKFLLDALVSGN